MWSVISGGWRARKTKLHGTIENRGTGKHLEVFIFKKKIDVSLLRSHFENFDLGKLAFWQYCEIVPLPLLPHTALGIRISFQKLQFLLLGMLCEGKTELPGQFLLKDWGILLCLVQWPMEQHFFHFYRNFDMNAISIWQLGFEHHWVLHFSVWHIGRPCSNCGM